MIKLESDNPQVLEVARLEVINTVAVLMPKGAPDFKSVPQYPMISDLIAAEGKRSMHKVILLMVKDLCNSINLVRNMNEGQMTETAAFLLEECGNFRLEDYMMLFGMIKRGKLVKIYDRIDMQVISTALDEYWKLRNQAGEDVLGDRNDFDNYDGFKQISSKLSENEAFKAIKDELAKSKMIERQEEEATRKRRNETLKEMGIILQGNQKTLLEDAIDGFCDRYINPEYKATDFDREFYQNNSKAIEAELKRRKDAME